jgi:hypothetical protein
VSPEHLVPAEPYDAAEHRKTMFAQFGGAFYLMNCFEHGLAIALMYVEFLMEQQAKLKKEGKEKFDRTKYEKINLMLF